MLRLPGSLRCWLPMPGHSGLRAAVIAGLVVFLYGCESPVRTLQNSEITGDEFTRSLAQAYRAFATFEADEMVDWPDAEHFARKGLQAAQGDAVQPEELDDWRIPETEWDTLAHARSRLTWVLAAGAKHQAPVSAATAQSRFDCWVEQQEENWQLEHIAACRDGFYALLSGLEGLEGPRSARLSLVLFAFNSAEIDADGDVTLDALARWATAADATEISVLGHTDRAGSEAYNMKLSLRRALAARAALARRGVSLEIISLSGRGESAPRIPTPDGAREARNRRAEIEVHLPELPRRISEELSLDADNLMFAWSR